ncbi:MAG: hypothetical protein COT14_01705 [Candidatus Diapherotrites archaeon CG08_land_8_20_14_0_20_30_16]|nr:MAG: hypothetical protein COT14_01705 [Candidatus Diapherotrites archaeon CG08_land_8_20_14_0_20_30_16]
MYGYGVLKDIFVCCEGVFFSVIANTKSTYKTNIYMLYSVIEMDYVPALIVGVISILYSAFLFSYQRYLDKKNNTKEKNVKMKEIQAKISDNYKTKDAKDPAVAEENSKLQKEMMSISMGMMKTQFKSMLWIMLLGLVVLYAVNLFRYGGFPIGGFWVFSNVITWFILISLAANIIYKIIFSQLDKRNMLN